MQKTNFTSRVAGLATLALAALPMTALSTAAHAAPASIAVSDLNLLTPEGNAVLQQRIKGASLKYCMGRKAITDKQACREGVHAELSEKAETVRIAQRAKLTSSYAVR